MLSINVMSKTILWTKCLEYTKKRKKMNWMFGKEHLWEWKSIQTHKASRFMQSCICWSTLTNSKNNRIPATESTNGTLMLQGSCRHKQGTCVRLVWNSSSWHYEENCSWCFNWLQTTWIGQDVVWNNCNTVTVKEKVKTLDEFTTFIKWNWHITMLKDITRYGENPKKL